MANGKTFIDINLAEDWQYPERTVRVRITDLIKYFATEARNMSGCRTLAGVVGDWRPVDNIAQRCFHHFREVNIEGLRREARKQGLIPEF